MTAGVRRWAALLGLALPATAVGAPSGQGLSPQGLSPQGLSPQGLSPQGLSPQGLSPQGLSPQGLSPQGLSPQLAGVDIGSVDLRGTTAGSAAQPFELTAGPGISTGAGDYISVGGASAAGHYAVAHLVDPAGNPAEDLDLYIADERPDPAPNLLHRGDAQSNEDVTLYTVFTFNAITGQWASLCPFDAAAGGATAMAIAEDPAQPNRFFFACTASGVDAKCARIWGFRPWRSEQSFVYDDASGGWVEQTFALKPFYDACKLAARAAYCQDRRSFTREGTLVDLFDTRQLVWPNAIENPFGDDPGSLWMIAQEYFISTGPSPLLSSIKDSALQRTRYRELSPTAECGNIPYIDRLEHDHIEDGRWASPLTNTPRIQVLSPNYCAHDEHETGAGLAWDCSPCTTSVCKLQPSCCRVDQAQDGSTAGWNALCVAQADLTCDDPPGRVWPRDLPGPVLAPRKALFAPAGAVERIDRGGGGAATAAGWACDPEWPGAAVTVAVYAGAPREQAGSTLLGTAYADRPLAAPLALEVSAACDGPRRPAARHGFAFALPPADAEAGPFFFYALDAATADGPAAPPELLRNGRVDLPPPLGPGAPRATVAVGWIEAPASGSYTFRAALEPSRVYVNGRTLVDWWTGSGAMEGSIDLVAGGKYRVRWDRTDATPTPPDDAPGLTWRTPGDIAQAPIPSSLLYRLAPGRGQGLAATYFDSPGFTGTAVTRLDPVVDVGTAWTATTRLPDGVAAPGFSARWQGEIVVDYTESYRFIVTGAGRADLSIDGQPMLPPETIAPPLAPACRHDICALGDKLAASTQYQAACHPCVDQICAQDPFCCDGGYSSYYATEPAWDAKCVAEVGALCGLACTNPLPSPTTRQRTTAPVPLQAGVRYAIRLAVDDDGADVTTQLAWSSARQQRAVVPARALFAAAAGAENAGAGLDEIVYARGPAGGSRPPDLATPLAVGPTPDLSLRPPEGANGLPLVDVLAAADDAAAAVPAPPAVVSPRFGAHVFQPAPQVPLTILGGVTGAALHARVQTTGQPDIDVVLPFDAGGNLTGGIVPAGTFGAHTLILTQQIASGAESAPLSWDVVVDAQSPPAPPAPVMSAPRDPTSTPDPTNNVFAVSGHGLPAPVQMCDRGGAGQGGVLAQSLRAADDGTISGRVTLTPGTAADPNPGWHKLSLSQDGCASSGPTAFVSVGIRPPTVEFPRSGAPVDCSAGGIVDAGQLIARGTLPYPESSFGRLVVAEELGRFPLGLLQALVTVDPTPRPDGSFGFQAILPALPIGKHLLYFFQAPAPPANTTQAELDAHYRAFASVATTPQSRIAIAVPPLPLASPLGTTALPAVGPLLLQAVSCALSPGAACALPRADVNVRDGARVWTTRASDSGDWQLTLDDLGPGWHQLTFGQVVDSPAGGGWVESCPSPALPVGVGTAGAAAPVLQLPGALAADATSAAGAVVGYAAGAVAAGGGPLPIDCQPAAGALFPLGASAVLCTAFDPATQAVATGSFPITVVDGPPAVDVPAGGILAEAESALGALVSYTVSATDAVSGALPVECSPSAPPGQPALFPLNQDTTVTCQAGDGAGQTTTTTFVVRVRDTTPPALQLSAPAAAIASRAGGALVTYAVTATDGADPAPRVSCTPAPGSVFALGTTPVACAATDASGNATQGGFPVQVTVSWSNLLAPINVLGLSTFLRPLPVAVKFNLTGASAGITNLGARLFVAPVDGAGNVGAERPAPAALGNLFRFIPLIGQYLLTLDTSGLAGGTWQLRVDLGDGVAHTARIKLL
jgi:hypothetical protein